jgi:hypothetical protein
MPTFVAPTSTPTTIPRDLDLERPLPAAGVRAAARPGRAGAFGRELTRVRVAVER